MSITDELRKWGYGFCGDTHEVVTAIADRIDAEHEKQCAESWMRGHDALATIDRSDEMAEHGWVRLPKDADGEYIHVGDVMESRTGLNLFPKFEVRAMRYDVDEWEVFDRLGDSYEPSGMRHYHAPTVEDMLWGLLGDIRPDMEDEEAVPIVAAYAKRLRLADDKE